MEENKPLWRARKRNIFGLPWSFTVYTLQVDKFCVSSGFLTKRFDEIRLYRINDFSVTQSLFQRIFRLGTIHIFSSDNTSPHFDIVNVRDVIKTKELISSQVEIARDKVGVSAKELISLGNDIMEQND